jgi:glycosyltransferase involved in cell wall biosynthesis
MKDAVFYGFQFPHHGRFSAFSALSREFEKTDVRVCRTPFPQTPAWWPKRVRGSVYSKWFKLNEYRLRPAFDAEKLVHYFFPETSLYKAPLWKGDGRLVLSCHQPVEMLEEMAKWKTWKYLSEGLKAADSVVLMASCEIDAYHSWVPNGEVVCIPHGVDTDFFCPAGAGVKAIKEGRFRILTVGSWLRDYSLWAETVRRVSEKCNEIEFTVIANVETLAEVRKSLNGSKVNVRLLHGISDESLRDEYQRADLIFIPLKNSWANNALLEGMSCGRPVVVTDLPATREYAGEAAWFIKKGCVEDAVEKISQLVTQPDLGAAMGGEARLRMSTRYRWGIIAQQYIDLYGRLLK